MIEEWRQVRQGDIFLARIPMERHGSIQAGCRPVIVVSADWLNTSSSVFTVSELTTSLKNPTMPVHYVLPMISGLSRRSMVLGEATARLIREDLIEYRCSVPREVYKNVDRVVRCATRKKRRHKNRKNKRRPNGKFRGKKG